MKNEQIRILVTAIYVANLNGNKKAASEGGLELSKFLKKQPDKIEKVKKMIRGLDIRTLKLTKELKEIEAKKINEAITTDRVESKP